MTTLHGFELVRDEQIKELETRARIWRHKKTGAELLSLENADENKVFTITFRTPPQDSTGVAHIMEHSVLCGSRKYPVKEPFVELAKGSLNTFLNAFTYPDKTCYPVASTNTQDFYNLVDVYMDAVLHPLIPRETWQQEGWHYELHDASDPLSIKGVVYNEMKGAFSSPDTILARKCQQLLFPDTPYGVESGGHPDHIPELSYEQFIDFHSRYYHPSNSRIFFYGDDDPDARLAMMDAYLSEFEPLDIDSKLPLQPAFTEPVQEEVAFPVTPDSPDGRKGMATVSWLLPEITDPVERIALVIMGYILLGTPASPLRKALIDSGLGEDLAGVGLETDLRQMYFSTGLKGVQLEDLSSIEPLVIQAVHDIVDQGIAAGMLEAAVNTAEFTYRENNTGRFPRGLALLLRSLRLWLYDQDPLATIAFEKPLNALKQALQENSRFFEDRIQRYLIENPHRVSLVMRPDTELAAKTEERQQKELWETKASFTPAEIQQIVEDTKALELRQQLPDSPEALATIPSLSIDDLKRETDVIPLAEHAVGNTRILHHDLFTNGIVYFDVGFDLYALPQDLLPYVPLFGQALLELGTESQDYVELTQRIGQKTGGIGATLLITPVENSKACEAWFMLRGKATVAQTPDMLDIMHDVLTTLKVDNQSRFRQMVMEDKSSQEARAIPAGHALVNTRLRAGYGTAGWLAEQTSGISNLFSIRKLAEEIESDWPAVRERLETIKQLLVNNNRMLCNVTVDADSWEKISPRIEQFVHNIPGSETKKESWDTTSTVVQEGLAVPSTVNYVGRAVNLYEHGYLYKGAAAVISNHLRTTWLWDQIRVQGGAYGAFFLFDRRSGVVTQLSYRDPNVVRTLDVYDRTADYLLEVEIGEQELTSNIIGAIGSIDAYMLPDARGYTSLVRYLIQDTQEARQQRRDQVFETSQEDFRAMGRALEQASKDSRTVIVGSQESIADADKKLDLGIKIVPVL